MRRTSPRPCCCLPERGAPVLEDGRESGSCADHVDVVAGRYRLGPALRRSAGCCAHRAYDELLQRTVRVTLVESGPTDGRPLLAAPAGVARPRPRGRRALRRRPRARPALPRHPPPRRAHPGRDHPAGRARPGPAARPGHRGGHRPRPPAPARRRARRARGRHRRVHPAGRVAGRVRAPAVARAVGRRAGRAAVRRAGAARRGGPGARERRLRPRTAARRARAGPRAAPRPADPAHRDDRRGPGRPPLHGGGAAPSRGSGGTTAGDADREAPPRPRRGRLLPRRPGRGPVGPRGRGPRRRRQRRRHARRDGCGADPGHPARPAALHGALPRRRRGGLLPLRVRPHHHHRRGRHGLRRVGRLLVGRGA